MGATPMELSATREAVEMLGGRRAVALSLRAEARDLLAATSWTARLALIESKPRLIDLDVASWCRLNGDDLLADFLRRAVRVGLPRSAEELDALNEYLTAVRSPTANHLESLDGVRRLLRIDAAERGWAAPHITSASMRPWGKAWDDVAETESLLGDLFSGTDVSARDHLPDIRRWSSISPVEVLEEASASEVPRWATWHRAASLLHQLDLQLRGRARDGLDDVEQVLGVLLSDGPVRASMLAERVVRGRCGVDVSRIGDDTINDRLDAAADCLASARETRSAWVAGAAVEAATRALAMTTQSHPDRTRALLTAGLVCEVAVDCSVTGHVVLDQALAHLEDAYSRHDPTEHGRCAAALASVLARSVQRGEVEKAIMVRSRSLAEEAVRWSATHDADPASAAAVLADCLTHCVEWGMGGDETSEKAIGAHEAAQRLMDQDDPRRLARADHLANAIVDAVRLGTVDRSRLVQAGELHEEAHRETPMGHPDRAARATNRANGLIALVLHGMASKDLLRCALSLHKESLRLTNEEDGARPGRMANVAATLAEMISRGLERPEALADALAIDREVVRLTADLDPRRPGRLSNLGNRLSEAVSAGLEEPFVLAEALEAHAEALDRTALDHPRRPGVCNNLAAALRAAFAHDLVPDRALVSSVRCLMEACASARNNEDAVLFAMNLGSVMAEAISAGVLDASLSQAAVEWQRRAVEQSAVDDARTLARRAVVGQRVLQAVLAGIEPPTSAQGAFDAMLEAFHVMPSNRPDVMDRVAELALRWSESVLAGLDIDVPVDLHVQMIDTIWDQMRAATTYRQRSRHVERLGVLGSLLPLAVLTRAGPRPAVEAIEGLRGHLGPTMTAPQLPSGVVDEALESEYAAAVASLSRVQGRARDDLIRTTDARLAQLRLDEMIRLLRSSDARLARFGGRPEFETLRGVLRAGEAAIYLLPGPELVDGGESPAEPWTATAIVVTSDVEPEVVSLPALSPASVAWATDLIESNRARIWEVAAWLHDVIVKPLRDSSAGHGDVTDWICLATGDLALLPLQAAGSGRHGWLIDSKTIRTLPSLTSAKTPVAPEATGRDVVAIAESDGLPFLESDRLLASENLGLRPDQHLTTADDTVLALVDAPRAVIAGHAAWSKTEGAGIAFRVEGDGSIGSNVTWLTSEALDRLPPRDRKWVFLSACSSARAASTFPSEAVGLPDSLRRAGFRSVVATRWPVSDHCAFVTLARFQQELARTSDTTSVSLVLRRTQHWMRTTSRAELRRWMTALQTRVELPETSTRSLLDWWASCPDPRPYSDPQDWAAYLVTGE